MSLGWYWAVLESLMILAFAFGAGCAASGNKRRGKRFMAFSALCAVIIALLFTFSPDNPQTANTLSDKIYELETDVFGG